MIILPLALVAGISSDPVDSSDPFETLSDFILQEEAAAETPKGWHGVVNVGLSATDGNTDIQRANAAADAVKRVDDDRYTLGFAWNYAEEDDVRTQRRTFARGQYDHFLTEKSYLLAQASALADEQADLDLRWTAGAGYGRQFRDDETWKVAGEAGLTYVDEEYSDGDQNDYVAARLAYNWDYKRSERWRFAQTGEIFPSIEDPSEDVYSRLDTRAMATLTEKMFAQAQWIMDWDNTPAEGAERADHLVLLSLGWTF